jgi:ABC-type sugar transport system permease subunit/ABC-type glycerol-3-phosphate transport system substrate-binding protein
MKKLKLTSATAILATIVYAASCVCARAEKTKDDTPQIELRVSIPRPGSPRREIFDLFLKKNKDIVFVPGGGISITGMAAGAQFYMAMAGGTAPDVFYMPLEKVPTYLSQNFLYPLDELAPPNDPLLSDIKQFVKPIVEHDGHIYAAPMFYKAHGMMFRKDLFAAAGLPPRTPRTWDEQFEFALRLEDPEHGVAGYAIYGGTWLFAHALWEAGGNFLRYGYLRPDGSFKPIKGKPPRKPDPKKGKLVLRSAFQEKPGLMAVNFYRRLLFCKWCKDSKGGKLLFRDVDVDTGRFIDKKSVKSPLTGETYTLNPNGETASCGSTTRKVYTGVAIYVYKDVGMEVYERFKKGKLGFAINSAAGGRAGRLPDFNPSIVGLGPMPIGPSGKPVTIANAGCYGVNSQIDDSKKEAAWRLIKFLCGKEAMKLKVKAMVERGQAAFVLPKFLEMAGFPQYVEDVPKDWVSANEKLQKVARAVPNEPGWQMVSMKIAEILQLIFTDPNMNVEAALRDRAAECDRILEGQMGASASKEMSTAKKIVYAVIILLFFAAIVYGILKVAKSTLKSKEGERNDPVSGKSLGSRLLPLAFMLPALAVVAMFNYVPLIRGSVMAFYDYKIIGKSAFVGIDNFIDVILSQEFWWALYVTVKYMLISLSVGFCLPIIVALMLDEIPWGKYFFRTVYYLPAVTSGLVIMLMWKEFYSEDPTGMLNSLFAHFGLGPYKFLKDPNIALLCVVIPSAWAAAGPGSILYLAALKCIPSELYEAAAVDGAKWYHKIKFVTIPTLLPLIIINFIGAFLAAMQGMGNILVMTGGGPDRQTQVLGIEIFYQAYVFLRFGYAISMAWVLGAMLLGFTMIKMQVIKKVDFTAAEAN